jgi:hypothetical protein
MLPWPFSEEAAAEKYMPQLQHNKVRHICRFRPIADLKSIRYSACCKSAPLSACGERGV